MDKKIWEHYESMGNINNKLREELKEANKNEKDFMEGKHWDQRGR